ncbi:HIT domain protein [uncultured archaeon]|nr:HIT domain protein [uncultured archaeon]
MTTSNSLEDDYQKLAHQVHSLRSPGAQNSSSSPARAEGECIFCKMIRKEIRARYIEGNSHFSAFLDIQPKEAGHVIVISKRHFAQMDEMDEVEASTLADIIKSVSSRMKSNLKATGFTIVSQNGISSGQVMPHFALHIIPTYSHGAVDLPVMNLINPQKVPEFVMEETERKLRKI